MAQRTNQAGLNEATGMHPQNPLIDVTHPSETLANCNEVLDFIAAPFVIKVCGEGAELNHDQAAGLWRIITVVQAAIGFEAERAPFTAEGVERGPRAISS